MIFTRRPKQYSVGDLVCIRLNWGGYSHDREKIWHFGRIKETPDFKGDYLVTVEGCVNPRSAQMAAYRGTHCNKRRHINPFDEKVLASILADQA